MTIAAPAGVAVIQGASRGIGLALSRTLLSRFPNLHVVATSRNNPNTTYDSIIEGLEEDSEAAAARLTTHRLDVTDESTISETAEQISRDFGTQSVRLLFNVAGYLQPEKTVTSITPESLQQHFVVNAFGPILVSKHFAQKKLLYEGRPSKNWSEDGFIGFEGSVVANMSARTGSIGDNRLGGWVFERGRDQVREERRR